MREYKIVNGTAYSADTPNGVITVLEGARQHGTRIRVFYGDKETGRSWLDEFNTMGTVGRSTGAYKIPLLIKRRNSLGGGAILDSAIVRITEARGGDVLYTHPNFHCPEFRVEPWGDLWATFRGADTGPWATFPTETQAHRWVDFITGRRNNK